MDRDHTHQRYLGKINPVLRFRQVNSVSKKLNFWVTCLIAVYLLWRFALYIYHSICWFSGNKRNISEFALLNVYKPLTRLMIEWCFTRLASYDKPVGIPSMLRYSSVTHAISLPNTRIYADYSLNFNRNNAQVLLPDCGARVSRNYDQMLDMTAIYPTRSWFYVGVNL